MYVAGNDAPRKHTRYEIADANIMKKVEEYDRQSFSFNFRTNLYVPDK